MSLVIQTSPKCSFKVAQSDCINKQKSLILTKSRRSIYPIPLIAFPFANTLPTQSELRYLRVRGNQTDHLSSSISSRLPDEPYREQGDCINRKKFIGLDTAQRKTAAIPPHRVQPTVIYGNHNHSQFTIFPSLSSFVALSLLQHQKKSRRLQPVALKRDDRLHPVRTSNCRCCPSLGFSVQCTILIH